MRCRQKESSARQGEDISLPWQVPGGRCFMMGDHRAASIDSRSSAIGCIDDDNVVDWIIFRI